MASELTTKEELRAVLERKGRVVVLGAHPDESRPSHSVPKFLHDHGFDVVPVNPTKTDHTLFGKPVLGSLGDVTGEVDVLDLFRPGEALPGHLDEILAMSPRPKVVWMQLGIRNDEVARQLVEAGIDVVQDHCMLAEHKKLIGE